MIRKTFLVILTLLTLPIWAQSVQNPFLYRISTPHGNSYILGTIHALVHLEDFPFDLKPLVKAADIFMPEIDTDEKKLELWQKDGAAALRLYAAQIPDSKKRVDMWASQKLTDFGFPAGVAAQLADGDCTQLTLLIQFGNGLPLDAQIMHTAHLSHRQIVNLDTDDLRNQAIGRMDCDFHQLFAEISPKDLSNVLNDEVRADANFYRVGIEPTVDADAGTLLRNKAWIPKIEDKLATGTVFVSVGYGHLFGPHGILQLLRNDGYTITRVSPKGT